MVAAIFISPQDRLVSLWGANIGWPLVMAAVFFSICQQLMITPPSS
jgi:hypothetical protein